ncbi:MAG: IS66 family transposase zinc-finger binding domain-containing protein, partial [Acidobacteriaceae bacterium]
MPHAPLPDFDSLDADALRALLLAQWDEVASLRAEVETHLQALAEQSRELDSRSDQIEHLKLMVDKFRRMMFGRKSEKLVVQLEQMEFELEDLETDQAEAETVAAALQPAAEIKLRTARKPLPEHLPREVVTHAPASDGCPDCGSPLRQFGEDVAEQLEYVPESFRVIRHVRPKFACSGCERVVEAPAPSRLIERGLAGPGLLA